MKVIVTGATGFVGTPLVRDLLAAGHAVTALSREAARAARHAVALAEPHRIVGPPRVFVPLAANGYRSCWDETPDE